MVLRPALAAASVFFLISIPSDLAGVGRYVDGSVPQSGDETWLETAFKTIPEGINAASEGDTVIVALAAYVENIQLHGNSIMFCSGLGSSGRSQPLGEPLHAAQSSYSNLAVLLDNEIGCLYERSEKHRRAWIVFTQFPLEWLTEGSD